MADFSNYTKKVNAYNPLHYPANKKISAEEWNALWLSTVYLGNYHADIIDQIVTLIPLDIEALDARVILLEAALSNVYTRDTVDSLIESHNSDTNAHSNLLGGMLTEVAYNLGAGTVSFTKKDGTTTVVNLSTGFVQVEAGKGLSSNDYTIEEKNKLANIEDGAEVNNIVKVNGETVTPAGGVVDIVVPTPVTDHSQLANLDAANSGHTGFVLEEEGKGLSSNDFTDALKEAYDTHLLDKTNPHAVTKIQVGLGNVKNTTPFGGIGHGGTLGESFVTFTDLDDIFYSGFYSCGPTTAHLPHTDPDSSSHWFIEHINSNAIYGSAYQRAIERTTNLMTVYERVKTSGVWTDWQETSPKLKQKKITGRGPITLNKDNWVDKSQTVVIPHYLNTAHRNEIDVLPTSVKEWAKSQVLATTETPTSLTFTCETVPTTDLEFRVVSTEVDYVS